MNKNYITIKFDIPEWNEYISNYILNEDLHEKGLEKNVHITLLYGINNEVELDEVKKYLLPLQNLKVEFDKIDIFENDDFDVVKFEVSCKELNKINSDLRNNLSYKNKYDKYEPHATIAYVKKGTGVKYIKELEESFVLYPSEYEYVTYDSSNKKIKTNIEIY